MEVAYLSQDESRTHCLYEPFESVVHAARTPPRCSGLRYQQDPVLGRGAPKEMLVCVLWSRAPMQGWCFLAGFQSCCHTSSYMAAIQLQRSLAGEAGTVHRPAQQAEYWQLHSPNHFAGPRPNLQVRCASQQYLPLYDFARPSLCFLGRNILAHLSTMVCSADQASVVIDLHSAPPDRLLSTSSCPACSSGTSPSTLALHSLPALWQTSSSLLRARRTST